VLAKIGMSLEGRLRQRVRKWGEYEDVLLWAVLRQDRSLTQAVVKLSNTTREL
jgi:RimJ/RimL family protein N-acetyltransferase